MQKTIRRAATALAAALVVVPFAAAPLAAQTTPLAAEKKMPLADFETPPLTDWLSLKVDSAGLSTDEDFRVSLVRGAGDARVGQGALRYSYEIAPGSAYLLALMRPLRLAGMQSVHFWVKTSVATALVFGLSESADVRYQSLFYCPANTWQEIALNLDELTPAEAGKDDNNKLDLDAVQGLYVTDLGALLAPLVPTLKGQRTLTLDDVSFSSGPAPRTTGVEKAPSGGASVARVDSFEGGPIRWMPVRIEIADPVRLHVFEAPLTLTSTDEGSVLNYVYTRHAQSAEGILRNLEAMDLKRATEIRLRLRSDQGGQFLVILQEKDGSRYQQVVSVEPGAGWKRLAFPLSDFTLADDSTDENKTLDAAQIKEVSVADVTVLLAGGMPGKENTLWLDDVAFALKGEAKAE